MGGDLPPGSSTAHLGLSAALSLRMRANECCGEGDGAQVPSRSGPEQELGLLKD